MITCMVRYEIDASRLADFESYARVWITLIEKYGGIHHGYFVPSADPPRAAFSFAGLGREGPGNIAVALFSFQSNEAYDKYRREVTYDPDCIAATKYQKESQCFTAYERTFLTPVETKT